MMIPWWSAILLAVGFTIWSIFCILIGAEFSMMNAEKKKSALQQNPKMN